MNRLQKKCAIATAGIHLLLLTILIVGPAFFNPQPKPDNTQLLDVIPSNLIDAELNSGVRNATPPAPVPVVTPPPLPTPPTPTVQPAPQPVVTPQPMFMEKVGKIFRSEPVKPAPEKTEAQPHKIQVNTQLVTRTTPKNSTSKPQPNSHAVNTALTTLRKNLSSPTEVNLLGDSTVAYANYASVVKSVYDQAWTLPDSIANDDENIKVTVTIASDGTVISARILEQAGDAPVDASVQRTLDRVTFVAPFPEGSADKQRTYIINFNPQIKKSE
jgi:TonB family protein